MRSSYLSWLACALAAVLAAGCTTETGRPDYTANGALVGAGTGAAIGALADRRAPGVGALIGAAAGALAGGLIGHGMDEEASYQERYYPPPPKPPPTVAEVKRLTRAGVADEVIIEQMRSTYAVYHLDADALIELKNAGVSQKVLTFMINSASMTPVEAPPAARSEVYGTPPGAGYCWVAGEWSWTGTGWVWVGGHWSTCPWPGAIWVVGYWEHGPRGWFRVGGHWR